MRKLAIVPTALLLWGCGSSTSSYVRSDAALGRVVVYKSGVAYFERTAKVEGDHVNLRVPADKVDDFLKSLTVVDAETGKPAPVSYPTRPGAEQVQDGLVDMKIDLGSFRPRSVRLSYVTEAPSWKPSYRVVIADGGKVDLQAWAIVDNTSGEDWKDVKLGVGSSSALSFRFDLRSIRQVQRETLQSNDLLALAPPTGGPTYGGQQGGARVVGEFGDETLAAATAMNDDGKPDAEYYRPGATTGHGAGASGGPVGGMAGVGKAGTRPADTKKPTTTPGRHAFAPPNAQPALDAMTRAVQGAPNKQYVIEGFATDGDKDKSGASLERANRLRDQLIRNGADPNKIVAVGRGYQQGRQGGARLVEEQKEIAQNVPGQKPKTELPLDPSADPIGTSHFESPVPMTVGRGTSAMISIWNAKTNGEVVYLYDAESPRGNATFPFRAVRLENQSAQTLESGPVTVFGEGKFIGEGMAEPIPPGTTAFVPFALDRQIVVDREGGERDEVSRILKVSRGVFSTEVQHVRKQKLVLHNRLNEPATVWVKHIVPAGYKSAKSPAEPGKNREKQGAAELAKVVVPAHGSVEAVFEDQTPILKSVDLRTSEGLAQIRVFLRGAENAQLKAAVDKLLGLNDEMVKTEEKIATSRTQIDEYRQRMNELNVQVVTLRAVKSAGSLVASLEKKMQEFSDKLSKATLELVSLQEKRMISRIHFEDGVADLTLEEKTDDKKEPNKEPVKAAQK